MNLLRIFLCVLLLSVPAFGRPGPQWAGVPENIQQWFRSLMQPDIPAMSCCGEADAFEADDFAIAGDHFVAVITDGRGMLPAGTHIEVPNKKINWNQGNPTGHGIIFLSGPVASVGEGEEALRYGRGNGYTYVAVNGSWRVLYCYVPPAGV